MKKKTRRAKPSVDRKKRPPTPRKRSADGFALRVSPVVIQSFIGAAVGTVFGQAVARILSELPKDVADSIAGPPRDFNPEPSDPLREVAEKKLREEEEE